MNRRWLIPMLMLLYAAMGHIDRVNLSVATPYLMKHFNLSPIEIGSLQSVFFLTYVPLVVPMGLLVDRFGTRILSSAALGIWSVAAALTGVANGYGMLCFSRLLLGFGESPTHPTCNRAIREWAPKQERGIMTSLYNCGLLIGPGIGVLATSYLIQTFSWRMSFIILGSLGLVYLVVWLCLYNTPEKAWWLRDPERRFIVESREPALKEKVQRMSFGLLLRQRTMWGLILSHGAINYSLYFFLTWIPTYLLTQHGLRLMQAGWYGALPYIIGAVANIFLCKYSDIVLKGRDLTAGHRRKLVILYMLIGSVILFVPLASSFMVMEALLVVSLSFFMTANTLNFALTNDLVVDKGSAGATTGLLVFGGSSAALVAPILTGFIIQVTHSYTMAFVTAGVLLILGASISWFMIRSPLQPAR